MLCFDFDAPGGAYLCAGGEWTKDDGRVTVTGGTVLIGSGSPVSGVRLVYDTGFEPGARFFGDAWERGYGELEWRGLCAERLMPWYVEVDEGKSRSFFGVKTGCSAFVGFRCSAKRVIVDIDTRSGAEGVCLEGRSLAACTLVGAFNDEEAAYPFLRRMLGRLCPAPRFADQPVYGGNNWYYAYGVSSREEILADSAFISRLSPNRENRPTMVIDDGWQKHSRPGYCAGGPWEGNSRYGDEGKLARDMAEAGVRPGIWIRPLLMAEKPAKDWILWENKEGWGLDPSHPETLRYVGDVVKRLASEGFSLIKHDYSTYDLFGQWGFERISRSMPAAHPRADRTRTNAEVICALYRAIAEAAEGSVIIGCNTVGHLAAGLFQLQRTGDDTSGRNWERTRRMGVNTLAMRMPQHRVFFDCDADCAAITDQVDWAYGKSWLDVLSRSGTPLFVSARPGTLTGEQESAVREAFARAAVNTVPAEPLDWQDNTAPRVWKSAEGIARYDFDLPVLKDESDFWWY